ncbi:MAG: RNA polymerase subunit sigma [Frankia sp.]|nr:RNA polymerase subunit sigma [Frankia sp.]
MARVRRGDRQAFDDLYDRYADDVFSMCLLVLGDPTVAQAAAGTAFALVARTRMNPLSDPSRLRAWLLELARGSALAWSGSPQARHGQPVPHGVSAEEMIEGGIVRAPASLREGLERTFDRAAAAAAHERAARERLAAHAAATGSLPTIAPPPEAAPSAAELEQKRRTRKLIIGGALAAATDAARGLGDAVSDLSDAATVIGGPTPVGHGVGNLADSGTGDAAARVGNLADSSSSDVAHAAGNLAESGAARTVEAKGAWLTKKATGQRQGNLADTGRGVHDAPTNIAGARVNRPGELFRADRAVRGQKNHPVDPPTVDVEVPEPARNMFGGHGAAGPLHPVNAPYQPAALRHGPDWRTRPAIAVAASLVVAVAGITAALNWPTSGSQLAADNPQQIVAPPVTTTESPVATNEPPMTIAEPPPGVVPTVAGVFTSRPPRPPRPTTAPIVPAQPTAPAPEPTAEPTTEPTQSPTTEPEPTTPAPTETPTTPPTTPPATTTPPRDGNAPPPTSPAPTGPTTSSSPTDGPQSPSSGPTQPGDEGGDEDEGGDPSPSGSTAPAGTLIL